MHCVEALHAGEKRPVLEASMQTALQVLPPCRQARGCGPRVRGYGGACSLLAAPRRGLNRGRIACRLQPPCSPVQLSTHRAPKAAPPLLPCSVPGQVRRLHPGVGRPAGQGGYSGRWHGARALRARRPRRRRRSQKEGLCRRPAFGAGGQGDAAGAAAGSDPPAGRPQTPRLAGTRGRLAPPCTGGGRGRPALRVLGGLRCAPRAHGPRRRVLSWEDRALRFAHSG